MKIPSDESTHLGFQIAPMIDVVFVIMLFFMVMAGAVKTEEQLLTTLPGTTETVKDSVDLPDEQIITIAPDGEVALNEEPFDSPTSSDLPALSATLMRLREASEASKTELLVTIVSDEQAKYSRTVDVLDACAAAQISNVTFTVAETE
jgi:biopolymer transport protein ExbD